MKLLTLGIGGVLLLGTGCAMELDALEGGGGGPGDSGPAVASVEQALPSWISGPYRQNDSGTFNTGLPSPRYVCALNRVSGHFEGLGEKARVYVDTDGIWKVEVTSNQDGVAAEAYCFDSLAITANGPERWVSDEWFQAVYSLEGCHSNESAVWWGDAVTYLTGISGDWDGGGEWTTVSQGLNATSPSYFGIGNCNRGRAWARSFFAGTPAGYVGDPNAKPAKFYGNKTYSHSVTSNGASAMVLAPSSSAFCMLTEIKGSFQGGGEFVELAPKKWINSMPEYWILTLSKGAASSGVSAKARCYLKNQL